MTTLRENIMAAVFMKLKTLTTLPAAKVFRSKKTAITRDESPCLVLRKDLEPPPATFNVHQRLLHFSVEIYVRGDNGETDADPIEAEVYKELMTDRTLSGKCILLDAEDTEFEGEDADLDAHRTRMRFSALYRVEPDDLSVAA